jgi:epoxyqueuosine reductase
LTLHYAKPHPLLNKKLLEGGIEWSSVIDTSGWNEHWNNHQPAPELEGDHNFLSDWLTKGFQSGMTFLEKNREARKDLRKIFPEVKSVLSIIVPYAGGAQVRSGSGDKNKFQSDQSDNERIPKNSLAQTTARYARVPDYHKAIKKQLNNILTDWAQEGKTLGLLSHTPSWRVVTDSLPFLDRAHARLARLGFIGKNTMLIRPGMGSYFFIAHVLLDCSFGDASDPSGSRPVAADAIADLSCGDCTRCIDACPTQAIVGPQTLDSNRCLSYLTIEHRDVVRAEDIKHFAEHFYGCDVCQEVCPYNFKTSPFKTIKPFQKQNNWLKQLSVLDVAQMSQAEYERWFGGTAMTRAKYAGLVRNALYSLHANRDPKLIQALEVCSKSTEPLILKTVDQLRAINKD